MSEIHFSCHGQVRVDNSIGLHFKIPIHMSYVCQNAGEGGKKARAPYHFADSMARDATNVSKFFPLSKRFTFLVKCTVRLWCYVSILSLVLVVFRRLPGSSGFISNVHTGSRDFFPSGFVAAGALWRKRVLHLPSF